MKSIKELRMALDSRQIGAVELAREYLGRIEKDDCNAFVTVCFESAINEARIAQAIIDKGKSQPLTGIPIAVKDNICTKGIKTTCCSEMLSSFVPLYDATAVRKIKTDGGIIVGKTNMDEFAMGSESCNSLFGPVKNPVNSAYVPGGSSGGSVVAVKRQLCVAALGSDTGGSVRLPASFCGTVGFKPTYGRISRFGLIAFSSSLDQIGITANTAEDVEYVLKTVSGHDEMDMTSFGEIYSSCTVDCKGLRIGIHSELFNMAEPETAECVLKVVDVLKALGGRMVDVSIPETEYAVPAYFAISSAEAFSNLGRYDGVRYGYKAEGETFAEMISNAKNQGFGSEVKKRIELGKAVLSDGRFEKAEKIRSSLVSSYNKAFCDCDILIHPTSAVNPYKPEESGKISFQTELCTVSENLAGLPSVTVPCGSDKNGMPVGISITGRHMNDNVVLSVASLIERSVFCEI